MDLTKSLVITSASPSLRTQRCTTPRTFCNLRSSAKRWGSVRMGRSGSPSRDSLITSLSLYSGRAKSWRRTSVERFILRRERRESHFSLGTSLKTTSKRPCITFRLHAALRQRSQDGHLILRVPPKPERKTKYGNETTKA